MIPRVGNVGTNAGCRVFFHKVKKFPDFTFAVASYQSSEVAFVVILHHYNQVEFVIVLNGELACAMSFTGNAMQRKRAFGRWVYAVADLLAAGCRRFYINIIRHR